MAFSVLVALTLQKPNRTSNGKNHVAHLNRRLALWKEGNLSALLDESRCIQRHLRFRGAPDKDRAAPIFNNLMLQGKVHSAHHYLSCHSSDGVLNLNAQLSLRSVTRYLVRVHKWSGQTKYDDIIGPTRTIYVVESGPPKTNMVRVKNRGQAVKYVSQSFITSYINYILLCYTNHWKIHGAVFTNNCQCRDAISSSSSIYPYSTVYHSVHLYILKIFIYGMRDFPPPKSVRTEQKRFWSPLQISVPS